MDGTQVSEDAQSDIKLSYLMISISDMKQLNREKRRVCYKEHPDKIVMWSENQSQVQSVSSVEHDSLHVPDNRKTRYSTLLDTGELAV